jgi:selenocysteine lyase/cysteine desulfurase
VEDGTLKLDDFAAALESKPRLVAVGYASNALGTINPVKKLVEMAHAAGR